MEFSVVHKLFKTQYLLSHQRNDTKVVIFVELVSFFYRKILFLLCERKLHWSSLSTSLLATLHHEFGHLIILGFENKAGLMHCSADGGTQASCQVLSWSLFESLIWPENDCNYNKPNEWK